MSLDYSGLGKKLETKAITIEVLAGHPLIQLANALDWEELKDVVEEDLKANIFWWRGRPLKVRIHLGMFLLQSLQGMTDRQVEEAVRSNAVYQVFCGKTVVESWHCPDHTKVEEFRNRLQPETQRQLVNQVLKLAVASGFAKPSPMDVDSTVQEAHIA